MRSHPIVRWYAQIRLHTKLILCLLTGLLIVVSLVQALQFRSVIHLLSDLSTSDIDLLREQTEQSARNVYQSVERSVAGSLERGEMEKFSRMLADQQDVEGLLEFSLYDTNGIVSHSSERSLVGESLPGALKVQLMSDLQQKLIHGDNVIEIYQPHEITPDCVRCHTDWRTGGVGGITYFRFSTEVLANAEQQAHSIIVGARKEILRNGLLGVLGIIAVIVVTMHLLVGRLIRRPLEQGVAFAQAIAEGNLEQQLDIHTQDEMGQLAGAFRNMGNALRAKAEVAQQIAHGNLSVEIEVISEQDSLGTAMNTMKEIHYRTLSQLGIWNAT